MSMSRNFLFHLLQDNQITLSKDYECTIKPQLYLINLPIFEAVPNIAYQNEVYKLQEAHLSIFSIYDKKERIPEFSVSHATLTFKVAPYANAQLKVRVYLDMGGQPQAVGGKYCTAKFITPRSPKGATFILNKSAEADLVQAALSLSNEIVDSVYNACEKLIEAKQKAIDNILEELNTLEDPAERYPLLKSLENECEWSEKYRPFDSTRKYNIYLKNFVRSELHAIENGKKERGKVAQSQLPIEPSASSTSSSSVIPVLPPTARAQAAVKPQRHKRDKALKEIKEGRRNLEAARKKMEENRCFQTIYSFWKNISIQLEMESSQLDVKQIFGLATRAKKIRLELENFLGEAFYHYEVGQDEPDELKQFLKLPFPDLKKFVEGVDSLIFSHMVLVGLVKMRKLDIFCQLLPHFHHLSLSSITVLHDNNLLLEVAKIADNDSLSCEFAQVILSRGARTNIYDRFSNSPLMWAVMLRNEKLIHLLLKYKAYPDSIRQELGEITRGVPYCFHRKDKGYENKQPIYDLQTPLLVACLHRDEPAIIALLDHKANPTLRSADGFDALGYYCYSTLNILADPLYASIKRQYEFYDSISSKMPIQRQAAKGDTIKKLIEKGCKVDAYQGTGETKATPLSLAIQNRGTEEINLLLQFEADIRLVDKSVMSAYRARAHSVDSQPSSPHFFPTPSQNSINSISAKLEETSLPFTK